MSKDWVVQNIENAIATWNSKLNEIWSLITTTPDKFKGGKIWEVITNIHGSVQAIGLALLVLFFVVGIIKTFGNINEVKKPEHALKLFIRFILAKTVVTYGMELMLAIFKIVQGLIEKILTVSHVSGVTKTAIPMSMVKAIEKVGFFQKVPLWGVTIIGGVVVTVLAFIMILTVYGRFFKLYLYTALAPIPLSTFAGEATSNVGKSFLKSYTAVCLEGAIIVLACIIFNLYAATPPVIDETAAAINQVWQYLGELIFNLLVLVGTVKMSDRVVREMMGL